MCSDKVVIRQPIITPTGKELCGSYDVNTSGIEAVYQVKDGKLKVLDDGDMSTRTEMDIMAEAPTHFEISQGNFTGVISITNEDTHLNFKENVLA